MMFKKQIGWWYMPIWGLMMSLMAIGVHGAENDVLQVFASTGPDTYADGTAILPGEAYALVWVRNGHEFAGFDIKGQLVDSLDNALVAVAGLGANREGVGGVEGYCPRTGFQIHSDWAAEHADGTYALVLVDTRMSGADGRLRPSGGMARVNGWGLVESQGTVASTPSALPQDCELPAPVITGVKVEGEEVEVRVKGTSELLLYNISASATPNVPKGKGVAKGGAVQGRPNAEEEISFRVPADRGRFFKVIRN